MRTSEPTEPGDIGSLLRAERAKRAETQATAAARFGITQPSYGRWEAGRHDPSDEHFDTIASYLGVEVGAVWQAVHGTPADEVLSPRENVDALRADIEELYEVIGQADAG